LYRASGDVYRRLRGDRRGVKLRCLEASALERRPSPDRPAPSSIGSARLISGRFEIERFDARDVVRGKPGDVRDVVAASELLAIAAEEGRYVPAVAEEIHDVGIARRVLEPERMPELVHAREVD